MQSRRMEVAYVVIVLVGVLSGFVFSAPLFTSLQSVVSVKQYGNARKKLADAVCSDPEDTEDRMVVSLRGVTPSSSCFQVYSECGGPSNESFCVQFIPRLDCTVDREEYNLQLECESVKTGISAYATVKVIVIINTPPYFSPSSVTATLSDTKDVEQGDIVYTTTCRDSDQDFLNYTLTHTPPTAPFRIDSLGVVRASSDLSATCINSVILAVQCQDPYNSAVASLTVYLTLDGANKQPLIEGLNLRYDVREDIHVGFTLGSFSVNDDDSPPCFLAAAPSESDPYFKLTLLQTNSWAVQVKTQLNYEDVATQRTNITVTCSDGFCTSPPAFLDVRVTQVNEPITLSPQNVTLTTNEGHIILDPRWQVEDEDIGDEALFSIAGGNSRNLFAINRTSGLITSTIEYDVDLDAMPSTETLLVRVRDRAGLTSDATVIIIVRDVNDNKPVFIVGSQVLTISDCPEIVGTSIGLPLNASDNDSDYNDNNKVIFVADTSINFVVNSTGHIIITNRLNAGINYIFLVTARDLARGSEGQLSSDTPARILVIVTRCITTPPPTTTTLSTSAGPTSDTVTTVDTTTVDTTTAAIDTTTTITTSSIDDMNSTVAANSTASQDNSQPRLSTTRLLVICAALLVFKTL